MDKTKFFKIQADQGLALTYDDVRMRPAASMVSAKEVKITSRFSRNVPLKAPLVSAAMDTVTESSMAIELAKHGGIGVIHCALTPEKQKDEVRRVKLHLNALVEKPVTVEEALTVDDVLAICKKNRFEFRTFPVVNKSGKLVGLVTQNDFDLADLNDKLKDIMTPLKNVITAPPNTTTRKAVELMLKNKQKTLPLVDAAGKVVGLYVYSDVHRALRGDDAMYNLDAHGRLRVAAAVPTDDEAITRVELMQEYLDVVVIDTAQGDSRFAFETLKKLKKVFPKLDVVVGNVSSGESAKLLAEAGADGVKVGQGPGSICTTRIETGIGVPQVTAVYECAQAVAKHNIPVIADGGINNPGDFPVAIAAGAECVMIGSKFAGTAETPGELITLQNGSRVKLYRGMGSPSAIRDSSSSRKRYGDDATTIPLAEGVESYVPYRGPVGAVVDHYVQALRKGMAYVGAKDIQDHRKNTKFIRITGSGLKESHPHDVEVIRPA
jgi:IMP dehydrogenase